MGRGRLRPRVKRSLVGVVGHRVGVLALGIVAAVASPLASRAGAKQDQFTVSSCPGKGPLPVVFQIDCSKVGDPSAKAGCERFIENQACLVFPTYRKITGINLEDWCSSVKYTIYDKTTWPYTGGDAGGLTLHCAVDYMSQYSIAPATPSKLGPYDTHEILHVYQDSLGALPYQHILFGPSQAEAMRLIGDDEAYRLALSRMKDEAASFDSRFAKASPRPGFDECVMAELQIETTLYLHDRDAVYAFYRKLIRSRVMDMADREARFNRMYDAVANGAAKQFLVSHGCAPF